MKPCIGIIDGQGGGFGVAILKMMKQTFGESVERIVLGTNELAMAQMLRSGAHRGASGESAICRAVDHVDCIIGAISITWPNAMLGEVTPRVAEAVTSSPAKKILIPLHQENITVVGISDEPLPHFIQLAVENHVRKIFKSL